MLKDEQKDRALEHINREGKRLEALSGKMLQMLGLYQNHAIQMEMLSLIHILPHRFLQDFYIQNCIYQQPGIQQKKENLSFTMNSHIIAIGISGIRCSFESVHQYTGSTPFFLSC